MRKNILYIAIAAVATTFLAACSDDDYNYINPSGNPVVTAEQPADALMGDEVTLTANCKDTDGKALSTLTAELCFSGEVVDATTIRTANAGDYDVTLNVPFLKHVPNGTATIRLTLQNATTKTGVTEIPLKVERPHFSDLQFIDADGNAFDMTEDGNYNYTTTINIEKNAFKGYFKTKDEKWTFGSNGAEVALGQDANLDFQSAKQGEVTVSFNSCTFSYGPQEELSVIPIIFSESDNVVTRDLVKGQSYSFDGVSSDWYYDPDFFTDNGDGSYTFNAIDGTYTMKAVYSQNGFRIHAGTADAPATLNADGTGAIWIIGDAVYGKPTFADAQGWWTDTDHALCMAPVGEKTYQVTFTVGKQLKGGTSTNFKFFGQAGWGTEFKGTAADYHLSSTSDVFLVGDGTGGHDDGNIYLGEGVELINGETYVLTIDLSAGTNNAVLSVEKK